MRTSTRRPASVSRLSLATGVALLLIGCSEVEQPLQIGSKDFTESLILGEIIAQMAESANIPVSRQIPYGGTFENIEALKRGDIDVYPEYNGTGLVLLGQPPISDGDQAYTRVEELYQPLGLVWGERFGFANDYELVMRSDRAAELGIETISDLSEIEGEIAFGVDQEFMTRPVDGFSPMLRRYGLRGSATVTAEPTAEGKARLYEALLEGEVDVVEGFSTDGHIAEFGLTVLDDDLDFFPTYQPAPLVRDEARQRFAELAPALDRLSGVLSTEAMRELNAAVELDGQEPGLVARKFLAEQGVVEAPEELITSEELPLAVGMLDDASVQTARALSAVRKTFSGRSVTVLERADPMMALLSGDARVAVVGAEAFYELTDGVFPQERPGAEALGVLGFDMAHILVPADSEVRALGDVDKLGVGPAGDSSERVARWVLTSLGLNDQVSVSTVTPLAEPDEMIEIQAERLESGELDALFLMAAEGHPEITRLMSERSLRLLPLPEWQEGNHLIRFPFLRVSRIPAGSYEGMDGPVDTIGAQVVLAGPASSADPIGTAGPGSAAIGELLPLADTSITELNGHLASGESLDPAIPSAAILRPQPKPTPGSVNPSTAYSVVNFLVICVGIYLLYLYFKPSPVRRRRSADEPSPEERRAA